VLDHVGGFGLAAHGITLWRVVGAAALVVGVILIRFFQAQPPLRDDRHCARRRRLLFVGGRFFQSPPGT